MNRTKNFGALRIAAAVLSCLAASWAVPARASEFRVLHSFCQKTGCADGAEPYAGLVSDSAGNLYGTTHAGGTHSAGAVFQLAPNPVGGGWKYKVLHSFCKKAGCSDYIPVAPLIVDIAGNLYGTTFGGGPASGTIFKLSPNADRSRWSLETLHVFCKKPQCADGAMSDSGLTYAGSATGQFYDGQSPLYGTTISGGLGFWDGVVYELRPSSDKRRWSYRVIHEFCQLQSCTDGYLPYSGLIMDGGGSLYGTTDAGGAIGLGTLFQLRLAKRNTWSYSTLYSFCQTSGCPDGASPGDITLDSSANLFGVTSAGGSTGCGGYGCGVLFQMSPDNASESVVYSFCAADDCGDGKTPVAVPRTGLAGTEFGTTEYGGGNDLDPEGKGGGVLYERGESIEVRYRFCALLQCADGAYPAGNLLTDSQGRVFGVTRKGGTHGAGVIYQFTP